MTMMLAVTRTLCRNPQARLSRIVSPISVRAFHSPFNTSTNASPLNIPKPFTSSSDTIYEKQLDHSPQPTTSHSGTQTYVVSEPDPSDKHYEVPSGAYQTTSPYQNFEPVTYEGMENNQMSSTSAGLAHPTLSQRVEEVGESAAARYGKAPGGAEREGSFGGVGMMDKQGTQKAGKGGGVSSGG